RGVVFPGVQVFTRLDRGASGFGLSASRFRRPRSLLALNDACASWATRSEPDEALTRPLAAPRRGDKPLTSPDIWLCDAAFEQRLELSVLPLGRGGGLSGSSQAGSNPVARPVPSDATFGPSRGGGTARKRLCDAD